MIHIHIQNIRINSINTIGSLNIGKAVLCHNQSSHVYAGKDSYEKQSEKLDGQQAADDVATSVEKEGET